MNHPPVTTPAAHGAPRADAKVTGPEAMNTVNVVFLCCPCDSLRILFPYHFTTF